MRVVWLTDIHLNFVGHEGLEKFLAEVAAANGDALLITGDIGESRDLERFLDALASLGKPLYFVLGNHDFYRSSIRDVRERVARLTASMPQLVYLTQSPVVPLTAKTALVGHDGWADGRFGDYATSDVILNDYVLIEELRSVRFDQAVAKLDRDALKPRLEALAEEAASHFRSVLPYALARHERVVVATHVPPFREACWHEGRVSDSAWLPHFASQVTGHALRAAMESNPERQMLVLCGHTHGAGEVQIRENLKVITGGAEYRHPKVQQVLEIE